ncbi:MAG: YceI family protein [Verrucomicrobia bacterium]|nr:YceI family protein [Verrucomicrobiota bacterium]
MKTNLMKLFVKPQLLASLLVLSLLFACKPKDQPAAEAETDLAPAAETAAAAPAAPAAPATPAAEAAPATPAAPAAPAAAPTVAAGMIRYDALPTGSKTKIEGTSTLKDWSMESIIIGGFIEADAGFPESALTNPEAAKPKVEVFMPVRSFKSYAKKMDEVMQEHMNEAKFKRIEYKLTELKPKSPAGSTGALQFEAVGSLTISGTTKDHTMPVTIQKTDGKMKVTGKTTLKMTDFGVKPPAPTILGMPTIKAGDEITITFEWLSAAKAL